MMTTTQTFRTGTISTAFVLLAMSVPFSAGQAADDGGLGAFFRQQFGIGPQETDMGFPDDRPLIVRPQRSRPISRRPQAKIAVGPVAPISIYQDTTLKPGDAIMTRQGVQVFLGGHTAPYSEADFVALADAEGLPRQVQKALIVLDKSPHD